MKKKILFVPFAVALVLFAVKIIKRYKRIRKHERETSESDITISFLDESAKNLESKDGS
jgi:cell division protein FtsL